MHAIKRHLGAGAALALVLAALAGSALAAPPSAPPGQEQTPPGQEQKAENAATPAPAQGKATAPGQQKKAEKATTKSTTKSAGINATTSGVKPSNSTDKNKMTTAGASPDVSKRYGNGQTAAQIATSRGAAGSTEIYGPGNSQPHKVCKKVNANGKEVWTDVHAVKAFTADQCELSVSSVTPTAPLVTVTCPTTTTVVTGVSHETGSKSNPVVIIRPNSSSAHLSKHGEEAATVTLTVATGQSCAATVPSGSFTAAVTEAKSAVSQVLGSPVVSTTPGASASAASSAPAAGGVLGVEATSQGGGEAGGVAGAFGVLGEVAGGSLPFTGLPLWAVVLIALAAIAIGYALWRRSHAPTARDVV